MNILKASTAVALTAILLSFTSASGRGSDLPETVAARGHVNGGTAGGAGGGTRAVRPEGHSPCRNRRDQEVDQ